jgi:hypothetical protein
VALKMPIVDIPLDDSKFRRFYELFEQYQHKLEKTPGIWQHVDRQFRQTAAAMLAQNQVAGLAFLAVIVTSLMLIALAQLARPLEFVNVRCLALMATIHASEVGR